MLIKRNAYSSIRPEYQITFPTLYIDAYEVKRVYFIKFLSVMLGENLTWKKHIELIESKCQKI